MCTMPDWSSWMTWTGLLSPGSLSVPVRLGMVEVVSQTAIAATTHRAIVAMPQRVMARCSDTQRQREGRSSASGLLEPERGATESSDTESASAPARTAARQQNAAIARHPASASRNTAVTGPRISAQLMMALLSEPTNPAKARMDRSATSPARPARSRADRQRVATGPAMAAARSHVASAPAFRKLPFASGSSSAVC